VRLVEVVVGAVIVLVHLALRAHYDGQSQLLDTRAQR
jgi:hypothetical protein